MLWRDADDVPSTGPFTDSTRCRPITGDPIDPSVDVENRRIKAGVGDSPARPAQSHRARRKRSVPAVDRPGAAPPHPGDSATRSPVSLPRFRCDRDRGRRVDDHRSPDAPTACSSTATCPCASTRSRPCTSRSTCTASYIKNGSNPFATRFGSTPGCCRDGGPPIAARLILADIVTGEERDEEVRGRRKWSRRGCVNRSTAWSTPKTASGRLETLRDVAERSVPPPRPRPIQGEIGEAVSDARARASPPGPGADRVGKTAAVLHPALRPPWPGANGSSS